MANVSIRGQCWTQPVTTVISVLDTITVHYNISITITTAEAMKAQLLLLPSDDNS